MLNVTILWSMHGFVPCIQVLLIWDGSRIIIKKSYLLKRSANKSVNMWNLETVCQRFFLITWWQRHYCCQKNYIYDRTSMVDPDMKLSLYMLKKYLRTKHSEHSELCLNLATSFISLLFCCRHYAVDHYVCDGWITLFVNTHTQFLDISQVFYSDILISG